MSLPHYEVECSNCGAEMIEMDNYCSCCGNSLKHEKVKPFYDYKHGLCFAFSIECDNEHISCNECDIMKGYIKECNS